MNSFTTIPLIAFLLLAATSLTAQVASERKSMSHGVKDAMVLSLPNTEAKVASKTWTSYMKDFYKGKTKMNRKTKEYETLAADIAALGMGSEVDVYATVSQRGANSEFTMWVDLGDEFLSPSTHPERFLEAEKIMMRYGLEVAKANTNIELNMQEKALKGLESDLKKLKNENDRFHREIEKAKEAIARAEEGIAQNEQAQEAKNTEIVAQQEVIELVKQKLKDL